MWKPWTPQPPAPKSYKVEDDVTGELSERARTFLNRFMDVPDEGRICLERLIRLEAQTLRKMRGGVLTEVRLILAERGLFFPDEGPMHFEPVLCFYGKKGQRRCRGCDKCGGTGKLWQARPIREFEQLGPLMKPKPELTVEERRKRWRQHARVGGLRRRYGVTDEQYDEMFRRQNGLCAVCNQPETRTYRGRRCRLALDHAHKTGKIRALVCIRCNWVIGFIEKSPELPARINDYLKQHEAIKPEDKFIRPGWYPGCPEQVTVQDQTEVL